MCVCVCLERGSVCVGRTMTDESTGEMDVQRWLCVFRVDKSEMDDFIETAKRARESEERERIECGRKDGGRSFSPHDSLFVATLCSMR